MLIQCFSCLIKSLCIVDDVFKGFLVKLSLWICIPLIAQSILCQSNGCLLVGPYHHIVDMMGLKRLSRERNSLAGQTLKAGR